MKNKKVIISKDRIFYSDGNKNKGIVMDKIAKPITEEFCSIVGKSRGDILDIGFGLGYSADRFYSMGVKSYTCIEINKQIYNTAIKWAEDKDNVNVCEPPVSVYISKFESSLPFETSVNFPMAKNASVALPASSSPNI